MSKLLRKGGLPNVGKKRKKPNHGLLTREVTFKGVKKSVVKKGGGRKRSGGGRPGEKGRGGGDPVICTFGEREGDLKGRGLYAVSRGWKSGKNAEYKGTFPLEFRRKEEFLFRKGKR